MSRINSLFVRLPYAGIIRHQATDLELIGLGVLLLLMLIGHGLQ